jgi:hypothetical protein
MQNFRNTACVSLLLLCLSPIVVSAAGTEQRSTISKKLSDSSAIQLKAEISKSPSTVIDLSASATPSIISPAVKNSLPTIKLTQPALKAGQVRLKPLSRELDEATRKLVLRRVPNSASGVKPVAVFNGAAEMLSTDGKQLTLRAMALSDEPLKYNTRRRLFEGTLSVGVVELESSGQQQELSAPVAFEVLGVLADPKRVSATMTAPPFETITIAVENPGDTVEARIFSVLDPTGESVLSMPVSRPRLEVSASPVRIQGWGLQKTNILVQATNLAGGGLSVQIASTLGELDSNTLQLDESGMGMASLRSTSTGTARIVLSGSPFESAATDVQFVFPMRYILAALIGGLAGGLLRLGGRRRSIKRIALDLLTAVVAGTIVFGLFVLGVNVTGFALPAQAGEVLVFVVTALGAFGGTKLFSPKAAKPENG